MASKRSVKAGRAKPIQPPGRGAPAAAIETSKHDGVGAVVETPLTRPEIEQFREMLLRKRAEILGDVSTLHNEALNKDRREAAGDLSSMPIHMADLGSDNYELEFTLGLIEGERAIVREIDEALERIKKNTYGVCLATGRPIGKARLKAKPWAKYCYEYTLAQEKGQSRRF
ncbi:MAG: TraR/DksA C4-type zinc finger protein [Planctomycetota bacterium]